MFRSSGGSIIAERKVKTYSDCGIVCFFFFPLILSSIDSCSSLTRCKHISNYCLPGELSLKKLYPWLYSVMKSIFKV